MFPPLSFSLPSYPNYCGGVPGVFGLARPAPPPTTFFSLLIGVTKIPSTGPSVSGALSLSGTCPGDSANSNSEKRRARTMRASASAKRLPTQESAPSPKGK